MMHSKSSVLDYDIPIELAIEFCADEGILDNLRQKDRQFQINSPFLSDNKRRCYIRYAFDKDGKEYLAFKDFLACGELDDTVYKGTFWKFIKLIKNFKTVNEAAWWFITKYLRGYDFGKPKEAPVTTYKKNVVSLADFEPLMISAHGEYLSYLKARGISWDLISKYKVFIDRGEKRIIFPVYEKGAPIFFNGRSILKWCPKEYRWKKSEVSDNTYPLWNLENIRREAWLFEGVFDGIFWPDKAVAYFGATLGEELIDKIKKRSPERVVLIGQNPFEDKVSRAQRIRILDRLKDAKLNAAVFDWQDIKEKDMNDVIVNGTLKVEDVEKRIYAWNTHSRALNQLEGI